jgi:hypothetical protein
MCQYVFFECALPNGFRFQFAHRAGRTIAKRASRGFPSRRLLPQSIMELDGPRPRIDAAISFRLWLTTLMLLCLGALAVGAPQLVRAEETKSLVDLATEKFGEKGADGKKHLASAADQRLFTAIAAGRKADYTTEQPGQVDPSGADKWSEKRSIHADRLIWLCTDPKAKAEVSSHGIQIEGARIDGAGNNAEIDLSDIQVPFPIRLLKCAIVPKLNLEHAQIRELILNGSHLQEIVADGIHLEGDLFLEEGFRAARKVSLINATVGEQASFRNGRFNAANDPDHYALVMDDIHVRGTVFFDSGFESNGAMRLPRAEIGGNVDCGGGKFNNPTGQALLMDQITVNGKVLLNHSFRSQGSVLLRSATIRGDLDCRTGTFACVDNESLSFEGSDVKGTVRLSGGFTSRGMVSAFGATIGENLECTDAICEAAGKQKQALLMDSIDLKGSLLLNCEKRHFESHGEVRFPGATIRGKVDCTGATFENGTGIDLLMDGTDVKGDVLMPGVQSKGEIRVRSATIGGDFDCTDAHLVNPGKSTLSMDNVRVQGAIHLRNHFQSQGEVGLQGATVRGNVDCDKAKFDNGTGASLSMEGINVARNVFLRNGFESHGTVRLVGATIGEQVDCSSGQFDNPGNKVLSMDGIEVKGVVSLRKSTCHGEVRLVGAAIRGTLDCTAAQLLNRGGNAIAADGMRVGAASFRDHVNIEGSVRLVATSVERYFNWRELQSVENLELNLQSSTIGTLFDDEASWPKPGKLTVEGLKYNELGRDSKVATGHRIQWLQLQKELGQTGNSVKYPTQPYTHLASVLRNQGREEEAKQVLMQKERDAVAAQPSRADALLNWLHRWTVGYGHRPWLAGRWVIGFVVVGTIFFGVGKWCGQMMPTKREARDAAGMLVAEADYPGYPPFFAPVYALETLIPLVKMEQQEYWTPNAAKSWWGWFLRLYLWFHIACGWALAYALLAGLTSLMRTT